MAHYDLINETDRITEHDLAKEIFNHMSVKDFVIVSGEKTNKGVSLNVGLDDLPNEAGNYLIYHKDLFNLNECVYSGESSTDIRYRVYRFIKELADKSRPDEGHSAAKKIRQLELMKHDEDMLVRYITEMEKYSVIAHTLCDYLNLDMKNIDEHLAYIAGAKFNKKVKKA
jgi:hypothetical protein